MLLGAAPSIDGAVRAVSGAMRAAARHAAREMRELQAALRVPGVVGLEMCARVGAPVRLASGMVQLRP